jgi:adenosylmethionine-8-amino-7-oxononanoate aminotransferase
MSDVVIVGTDTDAGKTTFAALWLAAFPDHYEYWKPVETGPSDTETVRGLVPDAKTHPPVRRFREPVAPPLAARREGGEVPSSAILAAKVPSPGKPARRLLVETFGGPLSPLNDGELQIRLIQRLNRPVLLVGSSAVGAVGRALQSLVCLKTFGITPCGVVLIGPNDDYAAQQIEKGWGAGKVYALRPPEAWTPEGIQLAARSQGGTLTALRECLERDAIAGTVPQPHFHDLLDDRALIWHPYTSLRDPDSPLVVRSAQNEFLTLEDGSRVIDGISSWWTILHGHRHPVLMSALAEAAAAIDHVHFAGITHPWAVELARLLLASAPWQGGRVFYSDNGSTAVEVALKMAYQCWCHRGEPQRTLFVGLEHGYHGDTFGAMAASRDPVFFGRFEPLLFKAEIVPVSAERLDESLTRNRGKVAAVLIEPLVQGAGGMRMHSPAELRALAEVARRHDVLFIADEVMTGGGRLGTLWAHRQADIAPDLICAAKTLTGGVMPLAATLAAPHVVAAFDTDDRARTFFHGHSFTAHPLACAVASANWRVLVEQPMSTAALRMERFWNEAVRPLANLPGVREVRVKGSIAAVELDVPGGYLADAGRQMRRACLERGVLLRPLGNVLYAMPPYCTSAGSLEAIADAMRHAVAAVAR